LFISKKSSTFAARMTTNNDILSALLTRYTDGEARELARWIEEELPDSTLTADEAVSKLLAGEPVQQVFEHALWMGLDLRVTRDTLIPRPETAELVEWINFLKDKSLRVLDIGTGSGCIAIALKKRHPQWQVDACDVSEAALRIAEENARRNDTDVHFFRCDILYAIPASEYDLIVSNPPYVCKQEKISMESKVLDYEPASALFVPDHDPLLFYRRIVSLAANREVGLLRPAGQVFFEINERFGVEMQQLMEEHGFRDVTLRNDMFGKPRMVAGALPQAKDNTASLFSRASAYCSGAERCQSEVADKLVQWGATDDETKRVLSRLEDEGFIDEARYARAYANDKVRFAGWGKQKIRQRLLQKRISHSAIDAALAQINQEEYLAVLHKLTEKKERELRGETDPTVHRAKLLRFLSSRGFSEYGEV